MFDIGFSELIVCAVVALIVIGPERMPEAVRTVGLWIGRFKRSLRETRSEIERQIGVDDIRRQLHNEEIMANLEQARLDMDSVFAETRNTIDSTAIEYKSEPDLPYHSHIDEPSGNELPDLSLADPDTPDAKASSQEKLEGSQHSVSSQNAPSQKISPQKAPLQTASTTEIIKPTSITPASDTAETSANKPATTKESL